MNNYVNGKTVWTINWMYLGEMAGKISCNPWELNFQQHCYQVSSQHLCSFPTTHRNPEISPETTAEKGEEMDTRRNSGEVCQALFFRRDGGKKPYTLMEQGRSKAGLGSGQRKDRGVFPACILRGCEPLISISQQESVLHSLWTGEEGGSCWLCQSYTTSCFYP